MNIGAVAASTGLPAKTIRYYEEIALVRPSGRAANGYRDYSLQDLRLLQFVARARSLGFPIEACRELLSLYRDQHRASADVKSLALARVREIEHKIEELRSIKTALEELVSRCHGDQRPDCPILQDLAGRSDPEETSMRPPTAARRTVLAGLALSALASAWPAGSGLAATLVRVDKTPGCTCCEGWAEHLRAAGFTCDVAEHEDLGALKDRLGIPNELRACHTAMVAGYVVEGHVPAAAIRRLLAERPAWVGIAVPGMPAGSPGMPSDQPQGYDVIAFSADGRQTAFMRFVGETPAQS